MRTRTLTRTLLLLLSLRAASPLRAQDPNQILDQYAKASGGSGRLAKLQTLSLEGSLSRASDGKTGTFTLKCKSPNRYYLELRAGEESDILAYNGKSAWHLSAPGEAATLLGSDALQIEAVASFTASHLLNLKKNKVGVAYVGPAKVSGPDSKNDDHHEASQIEFTTPSGVKRQFFLDVSSHLLLRESGEAAGAPFEITYGDYRPENGIAISHKLQIQLGIQNYNVVITRVAVNETVGERVFDFPRKSQVQLPDLKKLFAEIDSNQKTLDKLRENYTGHRATEETEFDGSGKITKVDREEHTFFFFDGHEVSTLIAKDGKPLSEAQQAKENEKTRKYIEDLQKREAKKDQKEEKAREEGKEEKDQDDPGIESFLRACQFVNPRRERFRGQDVLVFDFEGNPEYKPRKMVEKIAQQLAGVVWIDERQHQVARLEAYFVKDFRFFGGLLANLQKGTSFIFEQAFINNEVWLPTYGEAHVAVRILLKGFRVNEITRYSDYQRFNVNTLANIGEPKDATVPGPKHP